MGEQLSPSRPHDLKLAGCNMSKISESVPPIEKDGQIRIQPGLELRSSLAGGVVFGRFGRLFTVVTGSDCFFTPVPVSNRKNEAVFGRMVGFRRLCGQLQLLCRLM